MDVHAGKAVIDGPRNYLGNLYRAIPIGITVEGANILTRNLIVFGQGAVRAHPYLLEEMMSLADPDEEHGLDRFDTAFWNHVKHSLKNALRAFVHGWTRGIFASAPDAGKVKRYYRQLSRYAAGFAFTADIALLTLGGALKRREMLSARLGDILSELYLLSAVLKRWEDEGRQATDLPALRWCMHTGFQKIEARFAEVFANLPNRPAAWLLHLFVLPYGARDTGPADFHVQACADLLLEPSAARDRLTPGLYVDKGDGPLAQLENAFALVHANEETAKKMRHAHIHDPQEALSRGVISAQEADAIAAARAAVAKVVEVDDFAPDDLTHRDARPASATPMKAAI
jgi:acyl-CoA dehydrogenase